MTLEWAACRFKGSAWSEWLVESYVSINSTSEEPGSSWRSSSVFASFIFFSGNNYSCPPFLQIRLIVSSQELESAMTRNLKLFKQDRGLSWNLVKACNKAGILRFFLSTTVTLSASMIILPLLSINLSNKEAVV